MSILNWKKIKSWGTRSVAITAIGGALCLGWQGLNLLIETKVKLKEFEVHVADNKDSQAIKELHEKVQCVNTKVDILSGKIDLLITLQGKGKGLAHSSTDYTIIDTNN